MRKCRDVRFLVGDYKKLLEPLLTMNDAFVGFSGCLQMRNKLTSRSTPKIQTSTMLHA